MADADAEFGSAAVERAGLGASRFSEPSVCILSTQDALVDAGVGG